QQNLNQRFTSHERPRGDRSCLHVINEETAVTSKERSPEESFVRGRLGSRETEPYRVLRRLRIYRKKLKVCSRHKSPGKLSKNDLATNPMALRTSPAVKRHAVLPDQTRKTKIFQEHCLEVSQTLRF